MSSHSYAGQVSSFQLSSGIGKSHEITSTALEGIKEYDFDSLFEKLSPFIKENSKRIMTPDAISLDKYIEEFKNFIGKANLPSLNSFERKRLYKNNAFYDYLVGSVYADNYSKMYQHYDDMRFMHLISKLVQDVFFFEMTEENKNYLQTELFPAINQAIRTYLENRATSLFKTLYDAENWLVFLSSDFISNPLYGDDALNPQFENLLSENAKKILHSHKGTKFSRVVKKGCYFSNKYSFIYLLLNTFHLRYSLLDNDALEDVEYADYHLYKAVIKQLITKEYRSFATDEEVLRIFSNSFVFYPHNRVEEAHRSNFYNQAFEKMFRAVLQDLQEELGQDIWQYVRNVLVQNPFDKEHPIGLYFNKDQGAEEILSMSVLPYQQKLDDYAFYRNRKVVEYYIITIFQLRGQTEQESFLEVMKANLIFIRDLFDLPEGWGESFKPSSLYGAA